MPTDSEGWEDIPPDEGWEDIPAAPEPKTPDLLSGNAPQSGLPAGFGFDVAGTIDRAAKAPQPKPKKGKTTWSDVLRSMGGGVAGAAAGFAKELPLVAERAAMMPNDIASGLVSLAADQLGPEAQAADLKRTEQQGRLRRAVTTPFEQGADASTGEKIGRGIADAAPQMGLAALTGGASIPLQMGLGATAQGAQSLSDGAPLGDAALAAGVAGIAPGAAWLVGKAASPFAGSVNRAAMAAAERLGIKLPASAATNSRVAQYVEGMASKMLGGQGVANRAARAATDLGEAGATLAGESAPTVGGMAISEGANATKMARQLQQRRLWSGLNLNEDVGVPQRTLARLDQLIADESLDANYRGYLAGLRQRIAPVVSDAENPLMSTAATEQPRNLAQLLAEKRGLQKKGQSYLAEPWAAENKGLSRELASLLKEDISAAVPAAKADAYATANAFSAQTARVRESPWMRKIGTLAKLGQFDQIPGAIAKSKMSVDDIPRIFEAVGPEGADAIRASALQDIVREASSGGQFTPKSLTRLINRWKPERLQALLTPEQFQKLQDMATVSQSFGQMNRIQSGSPTAGLVNVLGMFAAPVNALRTLLGESLFAKFISSEAGQQFLTTGLPAAKPIASMALRGGAADLGSAIADWRRRNGVRAATR
jgi:hypothetical protein